MLPDLPFSHRCTSNCIICTNSSWIRIRAKPCKTTAKLQQNLLWQKKLSFHHNYKQAAKGKSFQNFIFDKNSKTRLPDLCYSILALPLFAISLFMNNQSTLLQNLHCRISFSFIILKTTQQKKIFEEQHEVAGTAFFHRCTSIGSSPPSHQQLLIASLVLSSSD